MDSRATHADSKFGSTRKPPDVVGNVILVVADLAKKCWLTVQEITEIRMIVQVGALSFQTSS